MSNILVIDGGGTKINGYFFNIDKKEIIFEHKIDKIANLYFSIEKTLESFTELINVFSNYEYEKIYISLAGYSNKLKSHNDFKEKIKKISKVKNLEIYNDIGFLNKVFDSRNSLIAILGTGSSYVFKDENKNEKFFGGWGHLFGDEGSSYSFATKAIKKTIQEIESNKNSIKKHVFNYFNVGEIDEFKKAIYSFSDKSGIADLSKYLLSIEEIKNICEEIIDEEVNEVKNKIKSMNLEIENIYFDGGFIRNNSLYKNKILKIFDKNIKVNFIDWNKKDKLNPIFNL